MAYRKLRHFKQQQREWEHQQDVALDAHLDPEPELTEFERAADWDDSHWERVDTYSRTHKQWGGFA
ncbi:hypothetical protein QF001_000878 [Paraburkholderia youngii]|uniref:hypothetical protein n=1 Tax=Paraburkholderia youngii TaxID=2782701 RepID=UPI003D21974C